MRTHSTQDHDIVGVDGLSIYIEPFARLHGFHLQTGSAAHLVGHKHVYVDLPLEAWMGTGPVVRQKVT
jgi:hypothetical protein